MDWERAKWAIQRRFNVLPTDPRFLDLTEQQIVMIVAQVEIDFEEAEKIQKGVDESYRDETYEDWEQQVLAEDADHADY